MSTLVSEQTHGDRHDEGDRRAHGDQIALAYVRTGLLLGLFGTLIGSAARASVSATCSSPTSGRRGMRSRPGRRVDVPVSWWSRHVVGLVGPVLASLPAIRKATAVPVVDALTAGGVAPGSDAALDRALRRSDCRTTVQIGVRSMAPTQAPHDRHHPSCRARRRQPACAGRLGAVAHRPPPTPPSTLWGTTWRSAANAGSGGARLLDPTAGRVSDRHARRRERHQPYVQSLAKVPDPDETSSASSHTAWSPQAPIRAAGTRRRPSRTRARSP